MKYPTIKGFSVAIGPVIIYFIDISTLLPRWLLRSPRKTIFLKDQTDQEA